MPSPTSTGNILVLYGHGAMTEDTFDFRRPAASKINLYSWTREGIPVWDRQIALAANDALAPTGGNIRNTYATVNSSRVGGEMFRDYLIGPPDRLQLPILPANRTPILALGATVHHNAPNLASSNQMLLMIDAGQREIRLSTIINDPNFTARALDILWCACKSPL